MNYEEIEPQQVKYVEAPLPAVNPWTKSKINTQPQNIQPQAALTNSTPIPTSAPAPAPGPAPAVAPAPAPALAPTPSTNVPVVAPVQAEKPSEKEKRVSYPTLQKATKLIGKKHLLYL